MSEARITDVAALAEFRVALADFALQAGQALTDIGLEVRRALDWITVDRPAYWQNEVRRASDAVFRAKDALSHARTYKRIGDVVSGCLEEKQALEAARRRLEHAERKVDAVRRWTGVTRRAVDEFQGPVQQLMTMLEGDIPRAMALLERMSRALERYAAAGAPAAIKWEELLSSDSTSSMAQPAEADSNATESPAKGQDEDRIDRATKATTQ